jgi:hypothetical protein
MILLIEFRYEKPKQICFGFFAFCHSYDRKISILLDDNPYFSALKILCNSVSLGKIFTK